MDWQQQQQQNYEEQQRRQQQEWERSQEEYRRQQQEDFRRREEERRHQEELQRQQQQQWQQLQEQHQQQGRQQEEQQRYWDEQQRRRQRDQQQQEEQRQSNRVKKQPTQSSSNHYSPSNYVSDSSPSKSTPHRTSSYFLYRSLFIRAKRFLILGVVAGGIYASNPAPIERAIHNLYRDHQETIEPIITPVQHLWQQFHSTFTPSRAKPQFPNSSSFQLSAEEIVRKQALNTKISQARVDPAAFFVAVDKLFYARHPELAGRSLTTHSSDANLRREWEELAKNQLQ